MSYNNLGFSESKVGLPNHLKGRNVIDLAGTSTGVNIADQSWKEEVSKEAPALVAIAQFQHFQVSNSKYQLIYRDERSVIIKADCI